MKIERYTIQAQPQETTVEMKQPGSGIGLTILSLIGLATIGLLGAYGPRPILPPTFTWIAAGFAILILLFSLIAIFYTEKTTFHATSVEYSNTYGEKHSLGYESSLPAIVKIASKQARRSGTRVFPYEIILLNIDQSQSKILFVFQSQKNAQKFIQALSKTIPLKITQTIEEDFFREKSKPNFS